MLHLFSQSQRTSHTKAMKKLRLRVTRKQRWLAKIRKLQAQLEGYKIAE